MISSCPSFSVLFHCLLIFGQVILAKFELFFSFLHIRKILLTSGLESLVWLEASLEVHPVLGGVIKFFLQRSLIGMDLPFCNLFYFPPPLKWAGTYYSMGLEGTCW